MDQDRITLLTRRGIREPKPVRVGDSEIEQMTLTGVLHFGLVIKKNDPSYFNTRKAIASNTHIFAWPSDALTILRVWDLGLSAIDITAASNTTPIVIGTATELTITGASNATPIVVTTAAHGYETGDEIFIGGVVGNTGANGTWTITKISSTTFSLDDSVGNGAWVSGGKAIKASLAHGLSDGAIAVVHDAVGNTGANGTWKVTKSNLINGDDDNTYKCIAAHTAAAANRPITGANYEIYWEQETTGVHGEAWISGSSYILSDYNLSLDGSVGNAAWTSGGKIFREPTNLTPIRKKNLSLAYGLDETHWYPRGRTIVVDNYSFADDILVDYIKSPSAITDIPAEYHIGLVHFNVVHLIFIPEQDDKTFFDLISSSKNHATMLQLIEKDIDRTFHVSTEPSHLNQGFSYEDAYID